jgi:hypothetical protein
LVSLKTFSISVIEDCAVLHSYHVCACDFITQLVKHCQICFTPEEKMRVIALILTLLDSYPNSTNFVTAIFRLIKAMVRSGQFLLFVLPSLFPYLIIQAESPVRNSAAACSVAFLAEVEESRGMSKPVNRFLTSSEQYCEFRHRYLNGYVISSRSPYGGPYARYVKRNFLSVSRKQRKDLID